MLQVQSPELYGEVVRLPELLLALEDVAAGRLALDNEAAFAAQYQPNGAALHALCKRLWKSDSYHKPLFGKSTFAGAGDQLQSYITMLGR